MAYRKVTDDLPSRARELYATGNYSHISLAEELGVGSSTVSRWLNPNSAEWATAYRRRTYRTLQVARNDGDRIIIEACRRGVTIKALVHEMLERELARIKAPRRSQTTLEAE